jgi:hypothetical protein
VGQPLSRLLGVGLIAAGCDVVTVQQPPGHATTTVKLTT